MPRAAAVAPRPPPVRRLRAAAALRAIITAAAAVAAPAPALSNNVVFMPYNDLVAETWALLPPTGRPNLPLLVPTTPTAFSAANGDGWRADATWLHLNAAVDAGLAGLTPAEVHQVRLYVRGSVSGFERAACACTQTGACCPPKHTSAAPPR